MDEDNDAEDLVYLVDDDDADGFDDEVEDDGDDDSLSDSNMAFLRSFSSFLWMFLRFVITGGQKKSS